MQEPTARAERVLTVLQAFRPGERSLSLADLAERTGLPKPSLLRVIAALLPERYLVQFADGGYRLGPKLAELGCVYQQSFRLEDHVMPVLRTLSEDTGESSSFYVREGDNGVCLFRVHSTQWIRDSIQVGVHLPVNRGCSGAVLVAYATPARARLKIPAFSTGTLGPDTAALACPVLGVRNELVGALTLSGPKIRFEGIALKRKSKALLGASLQLTGELGGDIAILERNSRFEGSRRA